MGISINLYGRCSMAAIAMALAMPAVAQDEGVQDIVVTAQRRAESVQRVPISITALGSEALTRSNITDVRGIQMVTPGIQIQPQFVPGNAVFQIRGQANGDTGPTIDASVGVYFDDVYIARSAGSLVNLVDISRVEVLKGAQGTLFGKNSAGGAIRLVSNRPTKDFEGYGKIAYESYDRVIAEGVLNVPLADIAALRLVGQYDKKSDGYGTNGLNGRPIDRQRTYSTRASLSLEPTDTLSILLQGDYSNAKGGGLVNYFGAFFPTSTGGATTALEAAIENGLWDYNPATQAAAIAAGSQLLASRVQRYGTRVVNNDVRPATAQSFSFNPVTRQFTYVGGQEDPSNFSKAWGTSAHIDWDLGVANLTSITAYRKLNYAASYNLDGAPEHFLDSFQSVKQHQFSQEILLNGLAFDDRLNWTVGGIYFDENALQNDRSVTFAALLALRGTAGTKAFQRGKNKSYGLFGQGTYKLTDSLSLTGGLRWSKDDRTFIANSYNVQINTGADLCVFTTANGLATLPIYSAPCTLTQSLSQQQWSYTAAIDYQIDPAKLLYARTSRGYRAGGFNPRILAPESLGAFKPEVVTDYELGLKADWLNNQLRTNIALFHSKSTNIQATRSTISATTQANLTFTENRGTRTINGGEMEIVAQPADWFNFNASLSYMDAKRNDPLFPTRDWIIQVPKWAWTMGATVDHDFGEVKATLHGDLSHRGKMYDSLDPPVIRGTSTIILNNTYPELTLINMRFTLKHQRSGVELAFYARNLTNELYPARQASQDQLGFGFFTLGEPRVLGAELKVPFGAAADR